MNRIGELSSSIFKSYEFEESIDTRMFEKLQNLTPEGGTALRDSIIEGLQCILNRRIDSIKFNRYLQYYSYCNY